MIVNAVLVLTAPKLSGKENLEEGMFSTAGIRPMGAGLHEPLVICLPLVIGSWGTVKQKLMKLLEEVREATWPSTGTS